MHLGVAYYPEHCKPDDWPADFEKIRAAGMKRVRMAEFAWSRLEPGPGAYQWDWLDRSIDLAAAYGLEVILCTPTAVPPAWLVEAYPEILPVNEDGRRNVFGGRQHRCYHAPAYQEHSLRIVELMARRYGTHPNVKGWQLDNEFSGEQKRCYCDLCRQEFQKYLADSYGTIENLNERWGNAFWSLEYQDWRQIQTPRRYAADLLLKQHPSLEMAFMRFCSDTIVGYSRRQINLLREHAPGQTITTNKTMFNWGDFINWVDLARDLDVAGIDVYSDHPYENAFYADAIRSLKSCRFWAMEVGATSPNLRSILEEFRGRGGEWLFLFKLKPFPFGQEQSLRSLLTLTGSPTANYHEVAAWARAHAKEFDPGEQFAPTGVGLYWDFESSWAYTISLWGELTQRLKYQDYLIHTIYQSLYERGKTIKIVFSPEEIRDIHTLVVARQIIHRPELEERLIRFVLDGGRLIVTPDLFQKNADNVYQTFLPGIYKTLFRWPDNDFLDPEDGGDQLIIHRGKAGKGEFCMIRRDAPLDCWQWLKKEFVMR